MVHHYSFRATFLIGAAGLLIGCWLRYAGSMVTPPNYTLTMVGQVVIGITGSIPMTLPSHYTNLWFDETGKVGANAPMSLASPAGAAVSSF
jgi:FLVCR family MFS transporter 7